ncbi:hypothetical protein AVEN_16834-1 [Araneus ventricosus]|uniref:Uncharacterized protein n=1 Tax=Araneus ventricosus TaxID=182803 RepID=A0A4Y2BQ39_ARAVE|nr:hypothetical protein AVEN_16834-1 [Araneus ventricosus]
MNARPPRLHLALWLPHNSPHHERLIRPPPVLTAHYPSSEMSPKSHTTTTVPTREARTCLLIRQLFIRELAVPGGYNYTRKWLFSKVAVVLENI